MTHYYTDNKDLASDRRQFDYYFDNAVFRFTTDIGVFSKGNVDFGSYLLIQTVYKRELGKSLLDLGCGYGPVGIVVNHFNKDLEVDMVDVNSRALELADINVKQNNLNIKTFLCDDIELLNKSYDTILLNPPIRAGKKIIYSLYEKSSKILNDGGSLYIVIQKKQGAMSSIKELETLYKNVEVLNKDGGYFVIRASI